MLFVVRKTELRIEPIMLKYDLIKMKTTTNNDEHTQIQINHNLECRLCPTQQNVENHKIAPKQTIYFCIRLNIFFVLFGYSIVH